MATTSEAAEAEAWSAFVADLGAHLAASWPAMPERLGPRYPAFVEHAVQQAARRRLTLAAAVARYVNLCFVWGPAFDEKPGFEWALGLLAAPREREWSIAHRLVSRSLAELGRLPEARVAPAALRAADERLCAAFGHLGRRGALAPSADAEPLPQRACDLEAAELRLLAEAPQQVYALHDGGWQRVAVEPPPPLRIDAARPAPPLVALLSRAPGDGDAARLQLRARAHAVCDAARHPALRLAGSSGLQVWRGHETRAVSFALPALAQATARGGAGSAIAEETSPDIHALELQVCGLRDEGDPLGGLQLQVWAWPSAQWLLEVQRSAAPEQPIGERAPARGSTRCRVECDGQPVAAGALEAGFADGLDAAVGQALGTLRERWRQLPALAAADDAPAAEGDAAPALAGRLALLVGRAGLSWGWRVPQLDARALMRVVGQIEMQAVDCALEFSGVLRHGGARSRLRLHCQAAAPLQRTLQREGVAPTLLEALLPMVERFRLPFSAEVEPLASETGTLLQAAGPCTGALVGEAGLRPRTSGGSGWEWFAGLRVEAVSLPVEMSDPLLGRERRSLPLLPALPLIDWRLG